MRHNFANKDKGNPEIKNGLDPTILIKIISCLWLRQVAIRLLLDGYKRDPIHTIPLFLIVLFFRLMFKHILFYLWGKLLPNLKTCKRNIFLLAKIIPIQVVVVVFYHVVVVVFYHATILASEQGQLKKLWLKAAFYVLQGISFMQTRLLLQPYSIITSPRLKHNQHKKSKYG